MNRKYMDFVPASTAKKVVKKQPVKASAVVREAEAKVKKPEVSKEPSLNELDRSKAKLKLPPKPNFVNTEKVAKRPLSNSVNKPNMVVSEEAPSGPVTIIDKPAGDSAQAHGGT